MVSKKIHLMVLSVFFVSTAFLIGCEKDSSELDTLNEIEMYRIKIEEKLSEVEKSLSSLTNDIVHSEEEKRDALIERLEQLKHVRHQLYSYMTELSIVSEDEWKHLKATIDRKLDEYNQIQKEYAAKQDH